MANLPVKNYIVVWFVILGRMSAYCSHLIGGELYYTKLTNELYQLEFKAYRDCINGLVGFDDPLAVSVFTEDNVYLGFFRIPFGFAETLPLKPVTPCAGIPSNVCVEETKYVATVRLPPTTGGYKLIYQRCCRNETIVNIEEPAMSGTTYFIKVFGNESPFFENSSPRFTNFPPIFLCANERLEFDHSATDPDGDSLVYELVTPWVGGDTSRVNARPLPAGTPPFREVVWKDPYNLQNAMGGNDPIRIDPRTGLLTGTPPTLGQYVLGVAVSEYRNGVLIQRHIRDFQFNVVDCPPPPTAVLPDIVNNCGVLTVFPNNSVSATSFLWDFGDPTATNDFSTERNPRYVYPSPGEYNIRLIASDNRPECADTAYAKVVIIKNPEGANFNVSPVCVNQSANFRDASVLDVGNAVRWTWLLENNVVNDFSGNLFYRFSRPGNFQATMVVFNEDGCSDTISKPIVIYPLPQINLKRSDTICFGDSKRVTLTTDANSFSWGASPELSCTNCLQPVVTPRLMSSQTYVFSAISSNLCFNSDTLRVFTPFVKAEAGNDTSVCPQAQGNLVGLGGVRYLWSPSSLVSCDTCRKTTTRISSSQQFRLEVRDRFNCRAFDSVLVRVLPKVDYQKSRDTSVCEGQQARLRLVGDLRRVLWQPRFGVSCDTCLSVSTVPLGSEQHYYLQFKDVEGCDYRDTIKVGVFKNNLKVSPDTTVCYGVSANLRASGMLAYRWTPSLALVCDTCPSTLATPLADQNYRVVGTDENRCEFEKSVKVSVRRIVPEARIENDRQRCFGSPVEFRAVVENYDKVCLGDLRLSWDFGDGVGKDSVPVVKYVYAKEGFYDVKLEVKGKDEPVVKEFRVYEPDSCLKNIYIPNTFTPNKDGSNDKLFVRGINIVDVLFKVYNNWGEEVFSSNSLHHGWDGTYKGREMKSQTFVYTCEATFYDGTKVYKEGNVTLLR